MPDQKQLHRKVLNFFANLFKRLLEGMQALFCRSFLQCVIKRARRKQKEPPAPEGCLIVTGGQLGSMHELVECVTCLMHCEILWIWQNSGSIPVTSHKTTLMILAETLNNVKRISPYSYVIPDITPMIDKYREFLLSHVVKWFEDKKNDNSLIFYGESPDTIPQQCFSDAQPKRSGNTEKEDMKREFEQIKQKFEVQTKNMGVSPCNYYEEHNQDQLCEEYSFLCLSAVLMNSYVLRQLKKTETTHTRFSCHMAHELYGTDKCDEKIDKLRTTSPWKSIHAKNN